MCRGAASVGGQPVIVLGVRRTRRFRRGLMKLPTGGQDGDDDDCCQVPATFLFKSAGLHNKARQR